mmetsp:Transcript_13910/g.39067  ORF Transcript_13910/g.39067 Transcript_13910/m.39067 type:complete len:216 (+) Transcript_13910:497-1144(+)
MIVIVIVILFVSFQPGAPHRSAQPRYLALLFPNDLIHVARRKNIPSVVEADLVGRKGSRRPVLFRVPQLDDLSRGPVLFRVGADPAQHPGPDIEAQLGKLGFFVRRPLGVLAPVPLFEDFHRGEPARQFLLGDLPGLHGQANHAVLAIHKDKGHYRVDGSALGIPADNLLGRDLRVPPDGLGHQFERPLVDFPVGLLSRFVGGILFVHCFRKEHF